MIHPMTDDARRAEDLRILIAVQSSPTAQMETILAALRAARDEGLEEAKEAIEENRQLRAASMQMNVAKLIINAADEKRIRTEARDEGLEEAAKVADRMVAENELAMTNPTSRTLAKCLPYMADDCRRIAAAIRSLKSKGGE